VILHRASKHPTLPGTSDRRQTHILGQGLLFNKDELILLAPTLFLVVHAHRVIFLGSLFDLEFSAFYLLCILLYKSVFTFKLK
jgi:hypothetical protein